MMQKEMFMRKSEMAGVKVRHQDGNGSDQKRINRKLIVQQLV